MFRPSPGGATLGVPGILVKFGLASADGMPAFCGASIATARTKRDLRWGGCRGIGMSGSEHHLGNAVAHDHHQPELLEARDTRNLLSLAAKLDILDGLAAPATWWPG